MVAEVGLRNIMRQQPIGYVSLEAGVVRMAGTAWQAARRRQIQRDVEALKNRFVQDEQGRPRKLFGLIRLNDRTREEILNSLDIDQRDELHFANLDRKSMADRMEILVGAANLLQAEHEVLVQVDIVEALGDHLLKAQKHYANQSSSGT